MCSWQTDWTLVCSCKTIYHIISFTYFVIFWSCFIFFSFCCYSIGLVCYFKSKSLFQSKQMKSYCPSAMTYNECSLVETLQQIEHQRRTYVALCRQTVWILPHRNEHVSVVGPGWLAASQCTGHYVAILLHFKPVNVNITCMSTVTTRYTWQTIHYRLPSHLLPTCTLPTCILPITVSQP